MIAALAFAAAGAVAASPQAAGQPSALIGQLFASPPAACAADGVAVSAGRVTGARLYGRMTGFAQSAGTSGGLGKPLFRVSRSDDPPGPPPAGSLRWAVAQAAPAGGWIAFAPALRGSTIALRSPLRVGSDITIDGGCAMPRLVGMGRGSIVYLRGSRNVVVTRLRLEHAGGGQDGDCITVSHGADRVWLAFLRLRQCRDGLIDVTRNGVPGPMRVTVSNNRFSNHDKAMLVAGAPLAPPCGSLRSPVRVTLANNVFYRTGQRHPRASGDALVQLRDNVIAFAPRQRGKGRSGGAYGSLAGEGAHLVIDRTLYVPLAGGKTYRLVAADAGPADSLGAESPSGTNRAGGCRQGVVEWRQDMGNDPAAQRAFVRSVIRATD